MAALALAAAAGLLLGGGLGDLLLVLLLLCGLLLLLLGCEGHEEARLHGLWLLGGLHGAAGEDVSGSAWRAERHLWTLLRDGWVAEDAVWTVYTSWPDSYRLVQHWRRRWALLLLRLVGRRLL